MLYPSWTTRGKNGPDETAKHPKSYLAINYTMKREKCIPVIVANQKFPKVRERGGQVR